MRKHTALFTILFLSIFLCLQTKTVKAQADTDNGGNFGVGFMAGEPTGVSIKNWNNEFTAIGIGAAWSLTGRNEALHLHLDYLAHSWFEEVENRGLNFYYGLGVRTIFADDPKIGARIPIGLNYVFQSVPFDLFVEAVPILDFTPDVEFAGNGAFGIRYYF
ncbi:MAG: hypothetical protein WEA58_09065 [Balneolaceae bacterium]